MQAFVFFTNVSLTSGGREELVTVGNRAGIGLVEVFDRERIRIALDGPDGLAIRYQYLGIPLSEPEQAAFFSRWGTGIESLITKSISTVEKRLARIEFVIERDQPLMGFGFRVDLVRPVPRAELGHFRFEWVLHPMPPKPDVTAIRMGICDDRGGASSKRPPSPSGYSHFCWIDRHNQPQRVFQTGHAVLNDPLSVIGGFVYDEFLRTPAVDMKLSGLDGAMFSFMMNQRFAPLVRRIALTANEYLVWSMSAEEFEAAEIEFKGKWPTKFSPEELAEPWVRILPRGGIGRFDFSAQTPQRLYHAAMVEVGK